MKKRTLTSIKALFLISVIILLGFSKISTDLAVKRIEKSQRILLRNLIELNNQMLNYHSTSIDTVITIKLLESRPVCFYMLRIKQNNEAISEMLKSK